MFGLVKRVLAEYPAECQPVEIQALGHAGGFSGAYIWRCQTPLGPLCLRRWPAGTTLARLGEIHALMRYVAQRGFALGPVPFATCRSECAVEWEGTLWDLTTWLPGQPIERLPVSLDRVAAAMSALAELHLAAASFSLWPAHRARAPVIRNRLTMLAACAPRKLQEWRRSATQHPWHELAPRARELLDLAPPRLAVAARELGKLSDAVLPIQACLRDVWRANVLWQGERLSGIVDWAAACCDSPAADIARLLGSLTSAEQQAWHAGLAAYQEVRPLDEGTLSLAAALDDANVVLAPLNWLRMLLEEGRQDADRRSVLARLDEYLARLRRPPAPADRAAVGPLW